MAHDLSSSTKSHYPCHRLSCVVNMVENKMLEVLRTKKELQILFSYFYVCLAAFIGFFFLSSL